MTSLIPPSEDFVLVQFTKLEDIERKNTPSEVNRRPWKIDSSSDTDNSSIEKSSHAAVFSLCCRCEFLYVSYIHLKKRKEEKIKEIRNSLSSSYSFFRRFSFSLTPPHHRQLMASREDHKSIWLRRHFHVILVRLSQPLFLCQKWRKRINTSSASAPNLLLSFW